MSLQRVFSLFVENRSYAELTKIGLRAAIAVLRSRNPLAHNALQKAVFQPVKSGVLPPETRQNAMQTVNRQSSSANLLDEIQVLFMKASYLEPGSR